MIDPQAAFDVAFHQRAPLLRCRPAVREDTDFLIAQFIACSPLTATLPVEMVLQQAEWQIAAHDGAHPRAMRRIATQNGRPIGQIMIDWEGVDVHGVDMAVLPDARSTGVGLHMLRALVSVCDLLGKGVRVEVVGNNPVQRIHARLGFMPIEDTNFGSPITTLFRQPRIPR